MYIPILGAGSLVQTLTVVTILHGSVFCHAVVRYEQLIPSPPYSDVPCYG
jgi:hypothetical protein